MKTSDLSIKELAAFIGVSTDTIRRALTHALDVAKIEDPHFHDLRHTFATRMVQAGIDLYKVQRLMGHKSPIMTQRYAHHYPESLWDGVDALEATLNCGQSACLNGRHSGACFDP